MVIRRLARKADPELKARERDKSGPLRSRLANTDDSLHCQYIHQRLMIALKQIYNYDFDVAN